MVRHQRLCCTLAREQLGVTARGDKPIAPMGLFSSRCLCAVIRGFVDHQSFMKGTKNDALLVHAGHRAITIPTKCVDTAF